MVRNFLSGLAKKFEVGGDDLTPHGDEYVELSAETMAPDSKVLVRPYVLEDFSDIKPVIESIRQGFTITLVNIGPLKEKDMVELKRAINKLKKTVEALGGDIAGFSDDYIVAVPSFATIHRSEAEAEE